MDNTIKKRRLFFLASANALLVFFIPVFIFYRRIAETPVGSLLFSCRFHDLLHLYCPACGGTRAIASLLRLDIISALRQNVSAVVLAAGLVYLDIRAIAAAIRNEDRIFHIDKSILWAYLAFVIVYAIVRDILLVCFSVDITGDFL